MLFLSFHVECVFSVSKLNADPLVSPDLARFRSAYVMIKIVVNVMVTLLYANGMGQTKSLRSEQKISGLSNTN